MNAFFLALGTTLLAELGDKTQLLAIVMVVAFRRARPILLACAFAILANHLTAVFIGQWLVHAIGPIAVRWGVGMLFIGTMGWLLRPDKADDALLEVSTGMLFLTASLGFFLAEFADKSQVVAATLAYSKKQIFPTLLGSALAVFLATVPAVILGERLARRVSMQALHRIAAGIFGLAGIAVIVVPVILR